MRVNISNRQDEIPLKVRPLRSRLERALKRPPRPLPDSLQALEIVLIDRAAMARIHDDFLGDPTETDVITFPYGEILICPAVGAEQASRSGLAVEDEVLLYALHGILHLAGYNDTRPAAAREMARVQQAWLEETLAP